MNLYHNNNGVIDMEHVKIRNRQAEKENTTYEMPLVNYNKEELSISPEEGNIKYNEEVCLSNGEMDIGSHLGENSEEKGTANESKESAVALEHKQRRQVNYIWIEAFFCAIILLGILIIQNVKNTEELQLKLRQEIRHNLTAEEIVDVGEDLEHMMQKYKNVTP